MKYLSIILFAFKCETPLSGSVVLKIVRSISLSARLADLYTTLRMIALLIARIQCFIITIQ